MTEKTLRELWEEADDQVSRYKHPSIGEFVERIDPVLKACGVSIIGSDEVKSNGCLREHGRDQHRVEREKLPADKHPAVPCLPA